MGLIAGGLFALNASGKQGDFEVHRMHDQTMEDTLGEDAPTCAVSVCFGQVDTVRQLNDEDLPSVASVSSAF